MNTATQLPRDPAADPPAVDAQGHPVTPEGHRIQQDIDPQTGQPIGSSVEPAEGAEAQPGDVVAAKPERVDPDEARRAIYESHSADLVAERQNLDPVTARQVEILEMIAAGTADRNDPEVQAVLLAQQEAGEVEGRTAQPSEDVIAAMQAEATSASPGATPLATAPPAAPPAAPPDPGTTFRLNVYGEERDVTYDDAVRMLQKEGAVDVRMEAVANRERESERYAADLTDYRDRLVAFAQQIGYRPGQSTEAAQSTRSAPSDEDVQTPGVSRELLSETVREIFSGDETRATAALEKFATSVSQGRQQATPPLDELAREVSRVQSEDQSQRTMEEQRTAANTIFKTEFAEIAADPTYRADAQAYARYLMSSPIYADKPFEEIARMAGRHVTERYNLGPSTPPVTEPATPPGPATVTTIRPSPGQIKRTLPVRHSQTGQAPLAEPAPKPPDGSDIVRNMRTARGQPV